MWLSLLLLSAAEAAMTCEEVLFLVRSDVPRANILHTLTQAELEPGAEECLHRNKVPIEYIQAAAAAPPETRPEPQPIKTVILSPTPEPTPEPPPAPPAILGKRVDVEVVGLQIGVCKTGGMQWDGKRTVEDEKQRAILGMVENGVDLTTIAGRVTEWGGGRRGAPDPLGFVELRGPSTPKSLEGKRLPLEKRNTWGKDTFSPRFTHSHAFHGIHITPNDALRVTAQDMEFQEKETIGIAEVPFAGLAEAFDNGQVTPVYVGDQTNGQLLYVLVTVRPSATTGPPKAVGPLY